MYLIPVQSFPLLTSMLCNSNIDKAVVLRGMYDLTWFGQSYAMVNTSLKVSFISCAEQPSTMFISNTLSPVMFSACFPLLRVALSEGVLQTPIVYSEHLYASNRNTAQVVLYKCKSRSTSEQSLYPTRTAAPKGFSLTCAWAEGMASLLFRPSALSLLTLPDLYWVHLWLT